MSMPYINERASKVSHIDIVKNPEIREFIEQCDYIRVPSEDEGRKMCQEVFVEAPAKSTWLPENVIAADGSFYEAEVDSRLPSTKIGYVKIGTVLIKRSHFATLRTVNNRFVDPFRVAKMRDYNEAVTFPLPCSNIKVKGINGVRDSFRYMMDKHLLSQRTDQSNIKTSLRSTLFHLASIRSGELGTQDPSKLRIHRCPSCGKKELELYDREDQQVCPKCKAPIYPSDVLRIWEEVNEDQSNGVGLSRFMNVLEHLIPLHYIRIIREFSQSYASILGNLALILDGPLALFGTSAWLHASIMRYIHSINQDLRKHKVPALTIMGLQKGGRVAEHVNLISKYIEPKTIFAISDDYRYKYITPGSKPARQGFGSETYYGQDFIYKTDSGRVFIFGLPYPFESKSLTPGQFTDQKLDYKLYPTLSVALGLIEEFESDLYENAIIPIALAHRHTAISLVPGSQVLDLLSRSVLEKDKTKTQR